MPLIGDVAVGLVTSGIYSAAADRPANKAFLAAWNCEYADKAIPNFLSADGWDGTSVIFDLIKATKGKFTGDEAIKFLSNWKTAYSLRGRLDRSGHARHHPGRLHAQNGNERTEARQYRVRNDPEREGPVEGNQSAKVMDFVKPIGNPRSEGTAASHRILTRMGAGR